MPMQSVSRLAKSLFLVAVFSSAILAVTVQPSRAGSNGPFEIVTELSCGKCGMFPAKYPKTQAQIIFSDGLMTPFDCSKCMFGFIFTLAHFDPKHSVNDIAHVWVRDFDSSEWIDAKTAFFVAGSDVPGPMGKDLFPFAQESAASGFQKKHGGLLSKYESVSMHTLVPLLPGDMNMKDHMKTKRPSSK